MWILKQRDQAPPVLGDAGIDPGIVSDGRGQIDVGYKICIHSIPLLAGKADKQGHITAPVSYTHLDVYKRQLRSYIFGLIILVGTHQDTSGAAKTIIEENLCRPENNTFTVGEELTYKIYYNWNFIWLSAGEVVFKVEDMGDQYKFTARGKTYSSYDWFFKADDYFESIVDKTTLLPITFRRDIKENKYRYYEKIEFDRNGNQLKSWTGKSESTAKLTNHQFQGCMRCLLYTSRCV